MNVIQPSRNSLQYQSVSKWVPYLIIVICAGIGGVLLLFVTNWGIGISPDSTVYISVARNFLKGYGFSISSGSPMTHYPPFYPMFLSLSAIWGQDPLNGARGLHTFLFVTSLALSGLIIYLETRGSIIAAICGILLLLCSNAVILVYSFAWSESLFILLSLAGLWLLCKYLETSKLIILLISSILIGFAFLTRYMGISLILTGCLFILLLSTVGLFRKVVIAAFFSIIALIPISLWLLRNSLVADTLTNRTFTAHPITWQHVDAGILTIANWLLIPQNWSMNFKTGVLAMLAVVILTAYILSFRLTLKNPGNRQFIYFPSIFIIFTFSYFLCLGFSISYADAHTPIDDRILSPLYIIGVIAIICIAYYMWLLFNKRKIVIMSFLLISFSFITAQPLYSIPFVASLHYNGSGYSNKYWKTSPIIRAVKSFPENLVIFSNCPDAIEILADKSSQMIPRKVNTDTQLHNENFEPQIKDMIRQIENGKAILIYFSIGGGRWYLPSEEEISSNLHVPILYKSWDGTIFGSRQELIGF